MGKSRIGIKIFGYIELFCIFVFFYALYDMQNYPQMLLIWAPLVSMIGYWTLLCKPLARTLNVYLSPLIVIVYTCGFFMILEHIVWFHLKITYFYLVSIVALITHLIFFTRRAVKNIFNEEKGDEE